MPSFVCYFFPSFELVARHTHSGFWLQQKRNVRVCTCRAVFMCVCPYACVCVSECEGTIKSAQWLHTPAFVCLFTRPSVRCVVVVVVVAGGRFVSNYVLYIWNSFDVSMCAVHWSDARKHCPYSHTRMACTTIQMDSDIKINISHISSHSSALRIRHSVTLCARNGAHTHTLSQTTTTK